MKVYLPFEFMKDICLSLADRIKAEFSPTNIVSISRGGNVPATIISKRLRMPLNFYDTSSSEISKFPLLGERLIFIEDLVAQGRTYRQVCSTMSKLFNTEWEYCPIIVDGNSILDFHFYGIKTHEWMVMPWEEYEGVIEGDRGLFREGNDVYGK